MIVFMSGRIQNILFDIGQVLVHLDYEQALARLPAFCDMTSLGAGKRFFALMAQDPMIAEYERGRITSEAYFRHFAEKTGFSGTFDQFVAIWHDIFRENTPMIHFGHELARTYDIYFLSNTGEIHFPYLYEAFPALKFCKGDALSCELGVLKPEKAYYEKALAKFGLRPESCLFIDDLPENVAGAERCGIRSILYTAAGETMAAVRKCLAEGRPG